MARCGLTVVIALAMGSNGWTSATLFGSIPSDSFPIVPTCPPMMESPIVQLDDAVVTTGSTSNGCQSLLECNVLASPAEATVYWYRRNSSENNEDTISGRSGSLFELIYAHVVRDVTLRAEGTDNGQPIFGLGALRYRLCADQWIAQGMTNEFKCRVQSACDPHDIVEGPSLRVESSVKSRRKDETAQSPLITFSTTNRVELAGNFVQLSCRAEGTPAPKVTWTLIDAENETIHYDVEQFPYLWTMPNSDVIISTAEVADASLTLRCNATNKHGSDFATSSVVILSEM
jgi:hypothetical protein